MTVIAANNKVDLYYEVTGGGPDVLLLHGWASSGLIWSRVIALMQHELRFWNIDLAGFGQSAHLAPYGLTIDDHVATLRDFCATHRLRLRAIVAHSMGGTIALKFALNYPEFAERIVAINPLISGRFGVPLDVSPLFRTRLGRRLNRVGQLWRLAQSGAVASKIAAPRYLDAEFAERMVRDFRRSSWRALSAMLESLAAENLLPHLHSVQQPVLLLSGKADELVPPQESCRAAQLLPNVHHIEFDDCHHIIVAEALECVGYLLHEFVVERRTDFHFAAECATMPLTMKHINHR
ncbi:MAG: alpha/beta hydrolase [Chloroflexi bacterium]|nr:MAG: alpha/beta hydrolase [Chloroflexota bacterium]